MTDQFCHWAMAGMGGVIVAMAGYIVSQHVAERKLLTAWLESLQNQITLLESKSPPAEDA